MTNGVPGDRVDAARRTRPAAAASAATRRDAGQAWHAALERLVSAASASAARLPVLLAFCLVGGVLGACHGRAAEDDTMNPARPSSLRLTSSAFGDGQLIPAAYTCDGKNRSPPLAWSGAPDGAASFALVMDDPDAPRGTWDHWVLWNLKVNQLAEGSDGGGAAGTNSFGRPGYGGPCPPSGTHHYVFRLFALDTVLDLPPSTRKADLLAAIKGHVLADARLVGLYSRG